MTSGDHRRPHGEPVLVTGRVLAVPSGGGPAGMAGVVVSDGHAVTVTGPDGRYELPVDRHRRGTTLVQITVPAGWWVPTGPAQDPQFFRRIDLAAGEVDGIDFTLYADPGPATGTGPGPGDYRFVALADVHVQAGTLNTRESYARQLEQIGRLGRELEDDPPRFITVAGDLTNDATREEFLDYLAASGAASVPVWSAPGNHDLTGRVPGGPYPSPTPHLPYREIIDRYRRLVGPEWYSFQYGRHHFVVLENYRGLPEDDQLAWLEQDLALGAAGRQVVVVTHVPWDVPQTPAASHTARYLKLFAQYDVRLMLAGHTHASDIVAGTVGNAVQAVTTSAAYTLDQTPLGFRVVGFRGDRIELPPGEFDADRRATVVHPVGRLGAPPAAIHASHYRPPFVPVMGQYRIPPGPWRPLTAVGDRAWTARLAPGELAPGPGEVRIRVRDRPDRPWTETGAAVDIAGGSDVEPRQGAPWPMFHRDAGHTGLTPDAVAVPLRLAWIQHTGGTVLTSSAAIVGGAVFIGVRDDSGTAGHAAVAFDLATGAPRWRSATASAVEASVAVTGDRVIVAPVKGPLRALDAATGAARWSWLPDDDGSGHCWMYYSPTVTDTVVYQAYTGRRGGWVAALDALTGQLIWHTGQPVGRNWISHGSPAVAGDQLFFATAYGNLVALDRSTGEVRWQCAFGGWTRSMPVATGDLVLLACQGDRLVAVDAAGGGQRWSYQSGGEPADAARATTATPAVADGVGYAAFAGGEIAALDLDAGGVRWRHQTGAAVLSSPTVSGDLVLAGSHDGMLRALDRHDGRCRWQHDLGSPVLSTPVATGNAVVVAARDGNVYAFASGGR